MEKYCLSLSIFNDLQSTQKFITSRYTSISKSFFFVSKKKNFKKKKFFCFSKSDFSNKFIKKIAFLNCSHHMNQMRFSYFLVPKNNTKGDLICMQVYLNKWGLGDLEANILGLRAQLKAHLHRRKLVDMFLKLDC